MDSQHNPSPSSGAASVSFSPEALATVKRAILQASARDLDPYDERFLARSLVRRAAAIGSVSAEAYLAQLLGDPAELAAFVASLDIHHSELFRDPLTYALLETRLLPDLLAEKQAPGDGELRVWSAGCATGQEAYSLAILLHELLESRAWPLAYRIFATDAAEAPLEAARRGVYPASDLGRVTVRRLERWFTRQGSAFVVDPGLRERVDFSRHDLLDPGLSHPTASIFGDFDLVLCCNLLYYYGDGARRRILDRLVGGLAPGGYLVTDATERELVLGSRTLRPVTPAVGVFQAGR